MSETPTVGRMVHYVNAEPVAHYAAVITAHDTRQRDVAPGPVVSLTIFHPAGLSFAKLVEHDATGARPGSWHWPERV